MRQAILGMLVATAALAMPASGQLLGGRGGGLGGTLGGLTGGLGSAGSPIGGGTIVGGLEAPLSGLSSIASAPGDLLSLRRDRLRALVRDNRGQLDLDDAGNPVRRDEILGMGLSAAAIDAAKAAGFGVSARQAVDGLDIGVVVLTPPKGQAARKALAALQKQDPAGHYTLDPIYEPARAPLAPATGPAVQAKGNGKGRAIGLIDGGVGNHPAFSGASIEQRGFAGDPKPSGHGTAVASLIVGRVGPFNGAAPGTALMVADIYGGSAANGSALAIVKAMGWLASRGVSVVNISLVGPANPLLEAGIKALQAKGIDVVAAVGNDGPAAPPQYPASYPGVIAVTGVDGHGRALIEAGKPTHLDFAAPGADMAAAVPGGGWEAVRGTSFAAPLVSARLAQAGSVAALAGEAKPGSGKVGKGIVCGDCRTLPRAVGLK